ncbi:hypothetical protein BDC45DRAFT_339412 [Circinella umbellata]|nr:hypothetical protein BDC45DRAFT_339412 [Circinella umbellata]
MILSNFFYPPYYTYTLIFSYIHTSFCRFFICFLLPLLLLLLLFLKKKKAYYGYFSLHNELFFLSYTMNFIFFIHRYPFHHSPYTHIHLYTFSYHK